MIAAGMDLGDLGVGLIALFYLWFLFDILRTPVAVWREAGRSEGKWLAALFFFPGLTPICYLFVARPDLRRARARLAPAPRAANTQPQT